MVMKERPERLDENSAPLHSGTPEIVLGGEELTPPQGLSDQEEQELTSRAQALVDGLSGAAGSQEMQLADSIGSLGVRAQRLAAAELDLLRSRIGETLAGGGSGDEIAKNLVELRTTLNQINPHEVGKAGLARRALAWVPFVGGAVQKALERIAVRYEPVSAQVSLIETRLQEGRAMLVRDNVELRKLYEQVEEQQMPIEKNAYLGELVMQGLSDLVERTEDPLRKERMRNVLRDVAMRVQGLRAMEEVHAQFFVSIEMTRQNNNRLGQSVERTLALGINVVLIGLAIQMALSRQKLVLEAMRGTRDFVGNLIAANAASLKSHTEEIGDVYNQPVIAIDKITQAHDDLMEAMDTADRVNREGIAAARTNLAELSGMAAELERRALGTGEQPVEESLEA